MPQHTETETETFTVAWDRDETEPCQANTPGCCVDHTASPGHGCECW